MFQELPVPAHVFHDLRPSAVAVSATYWRGISFVRSLVYLSGIPKSLHLWLQRLAELDSVFFGVR